MAAGITYIPPSKIETATNYQNKLTPEYNFTSGAYLPITEDKSLALEPSVLTKSTSWSDTQVDFGLRFIYENRLKSLSSGKTVLKIGNNLLLKNKDMIENFDNFFREIRSYIMYGSLSFSDLIFEDLEDVENIFKEYGISFHFISSI